MRCGLLGRKLGHSYSPAIHKALGNYSYDLFEVEPENLKAFLRSGDFTGLNVTMPYKKAVIPYLDDLSPIARQLGAVNTIVRKADGSLVGHNSDYFGFSYMLKQSGISPAGKKALVLGSGGASATVQAVLQAQGTLVTVISRKGNNNYENLEIHSNAAIIVNTTPVGMYPDTGLSPVDLSRFADLEAVLDVVYNPARTALLLQAEALGIPCLGGLPMLVAQAWESARWFTGENIPESKIQEILADLQKKTQNIVLIGMPGCGKSTVGSLLAQRMGRKFMDTDACIQEKAGMSIPEIFDTCGEAHFRTLETQVLQALGKQSGLVIACGGGVVTQERNYPLLHQNGCILWLERDISLLPTQGRPLSMRGDLAEMYRLRQPLYARFADLTISNHSAPEATVEKILEAVL